MIQKYLAIILLFLSFRGEAQMVKFIKNPVTALITDSLLAKKDEKEQVESNVMPWYKKDKEELRAVYIIRLCAYLCKI